MIKIFPLKVLFNKIKKIVLFSLQDSIKQLYTLLFLFSIVQLLIIPNTFAKQATPFSNKTNLYSILQDNKDFLWLPGQNGLYRFDGKEVINFSNKTKGWSIPFTWIHSIAAKDNQLIITTETNGLWLFDIITGKTQPIPIEAATKTFYNAIHHNDSYFAISMGPQHLYRYDIATENTSLIAKNINNNLLLASDNGIYFNDNETLFYLDNNQNKAQIKEVTAVNERIIASTKVNDVIILASENHLFAIKANGEIIKQAISSPITALTSYNDQKSVLSVNILGEIAKRDLITLKLLNNNFSTVEKSRYKVLLHDSSGVLWLGNNRRFQQLTENKIKNHAVIFDTNISAIETEVYQNELYLGSYGQGIHTFSPATAKNSVSIKNINQKLSLKGKKTTDLLAVDQNLFIATFDGLWRYNKANKETVKVDLSFNNVNLNHLILLKLRQNKNLLYIATDGQGFITYDLKKERVTQHITINSGLSSGEVIDILPLINGDIWLATASGIDVFNNKTNTIDNVITDKTTKFISLLQADNKIFIASKGNGIRVFNPQKQLLSHFSKEVNFGYMSLIDDHIYASAKPGLYKINPANYQVSMVTNTSDYSFTDNAFIFKEILYTANSSGVLQLPRVTAPAFHPKVYISKTTVSGNAYLLNKAINISSGNDVITLDLASLDYRTGLEKQYKYTLNGNDWYQISGNQLTLTGLASGDYHIEIMATNSLGQWSKNRAYTDINVAFPWYWTPQIRLIYGVSLVGIIFLSAWLLFLRSKSISHIHNLLQSDINNYGKTSMQVKRNLTAALTLIDEEQLSKSKLLLQQCVDDLNKQQTSPEPNTLNGNSLTEAVPFLAQYLQNKYQVKLFFQLELNEKELNYELQADLYRVIFEAINSAILNGNGRSFKVVLQKFKNKIWLNISDDGQSFINFNNKVNFDISMYYIRKTASKHQGSINTFNEQGNASQLVLSLPVRN